MTFTIKLHPSGKLFTAGSESSLLDSALAAGLALPHSCKRGDCSECIATTADGESIKTCITKPESDMELHVDYIAELEGITQKLLPARVDSVDLRGEVAVLKLRLPPTAAFKYLPGQYINIKYQGVERSYSIANAGSDGLELHVARVPDGFFSTYVFEQCKKNDLLRFEGPFGTSVLRNDSRPLLLVCGGTGFAPMKAMVEQLLDADDTRPIKLYWGVRHQDLAYWSIPEGWRSADRLHVEVVVSDQADWSGRKDWVHQAVLDDIDSVEGWSVFSCGAPPMIDALKNGLVSRGLESNYFYSDPFLPAEAEKTE